MPARLLLLISLSLGPLCAQAFEVATIREHTDRVRSIGVMPSGDRLSMEAMSLEDVVSYAYNLKDYQVSGAGWVETARWDVTAKAPLAGLGNAEFRKMTQALLADRFHVQFHRDSKEMFVYALVIATKGRPKLKPSAADARDGTTISGDRTAGGDRRAVLSPATGAFAYRLEWAPDDGTSDAPSIYTAVQEQLGLKLEPQKAAVELLVIDGAEKPSEN